MHIVPEHFIDAHLENAFKVRIDGFVENTTDAQLVDVQARRVSVVKDLGVTESMGRGTVKINRGAARNVMRETL